MSHSEVPEPTEVLDTDEQETPATCRPWVRPAILAGMTLGAIAIVASSGDPTTVGGII
jgi:hypothetical protein